MARKTFAAGRNCTASTAWRMNEAASAWNMSFNESILLHTLGNDLGLWVGNCGTVWFHKIRKSIFFLSGESTQKKRKVAFSDFVELRSSTEKKFLISNRENADAVRFGV
jgi:hypothetical protein